MPFFKNPNIKNILQRSTKTLQSFSSYITIGAVVKQVLYIRTLNMAVKYVLCLPLANANLANVLIFLWSFDTWVECTDLYINLYCIPSKAFCTFYSS